MKPPAQGNPPMSADRLFLDLIVIPFWYVDCFCLLANLVTCHFALFLDVVHFDSKWRVIWWYEACKNSWVHRQYTSSTRTDYDQIRRCPQRLPWRCLLFCGGEAKPGYSQLNSVTFIENNNWLVVLLTWHNFNCPTFWKRTSEKIWRCC